MEKATKRKEPESQRISWFLYSFERRLRCIINKQKTLTEGDDGMASSSILLYKIKFEQEYHIDEIINRIENDILDETRIVVEDYTETSLSGIYIYAEIYKSQGKTRRLFYSCRWPYGLVLQR